MANKKITDYTEVLAAGVDDFLDISVDLGGGVYDTRKIKASNIGGASPLTTKGDLFTYDTDDARLPIGTDGQALIADSAEATGLKWGTVSADNMATADLTLTGDRTHDLDGNVLKFDNGQVTIEGVSTSPSQLSLLIQNSIATQLFKIDNSGYIEGKEMSIKSDFSNTVTFSHKSSSNSGFLHGSSGASALATNDGDINFFTSSAGYLGAVNGVIKSTSNGGGWGIGTSTTETGYRLTVNGDIKSGVAVMVASGTNAIFRNFNESNGGFYHNSSSGVFIGADNNNITFVTGVNGVNGPDSSKSGIINNSRQWAIGSIDIDASAVLSVNSTTKGFLPPRMTTTQKNAISSPTAGLVVFDNTLAKLCVYTGSAWETVTSA